MASEVIAQLRQEVQRRLPREVPVSAVQFEGPTLVIYTPESRRLAEDHELVRTLARELKKRIAIRPDPKNLIAPEAAEKTLRAMVPPDSGISDLFFNAETGEVVIEAQKPGLVIGRQGSTLREVTKAIGWSPRVVRTPPLASSTVRQIRTLLRTFADERKVLLHRIGQKIHRPSAPRDQWVRLTPLGGFREVGRNAYLLSTPESRILVDCGITAGSDKNSTPYLYVPEASPLTQLDAVVLTHAHLDHCGLVPYLFKYGYDGPVYCSPPTRDLMALLTLDFLEVAAREGRKVPYDSGDIREAIKHTIPIDFGEVTDIAPDVKITLQNSGHILGSSVVHFHIGDGSYNVAFTGDFKLERSLLFDGASFRFPRLETLVMEATYGAHGDLQPTRREAQEKMEAIIQRSLARGGKVLIPAFAVGRSQEVMLVLEDSLRRKRIPEVPIYTDGMISEATAIHTAYPEYLNSDLRDRIFHRGENPFLSDLFIQVESPARRAEIAERGQAIVLATSGMMNGGPVMEHFRNFAPSEKNTLVFVGYQAEGTMGRRIQKGWNEVQREGESIKIGLQVETVDGFSGHSDWEELVEYVHRCSPRPERVITAHGDGSKCIELASFIYKRFRIETRSPMNLETVRLV
ncbi:MAG: beta-CASP ribonuclease aCPSF1 [Halobacteria archaeon]